MKNNSSEIRNKFINYFTSKGHTYVVSSPILPPNDDKSLLFTNAGMVQFKDIFLGLSEPKYKCAVTSQKCIRAGGKHNDLDNVGFTNRHHTFFEMLGNFSFGDYFKHDAIKYAWDFLTNELKIPQEKLWITVHESDRDSKSIWVNEIGVEKDKISVINTNDNFWSMGDLGPCGPCTEIFYDFGSKFKGMPPGQGDEGDRFVEIWNLVFMQYNRISKDKIIDLPKPSVDTGMGLERICAVMQDQYSNYDTDLFLPMLNYIKNNIQEKYHNEISSMKVIADHIRSTSFLITEGVKPSNEGHGYVLRRIIRRAIRHAQKIELPIEKFLEIVPVFIDTLSNHYQELNKKDLIIDTLKNEAIKFTDTLDTGLEILDKNIKKIITSKSDKKFSGKLLFLLYDTYGFPVDLTSTIAKEKGFDIDLASFQKLMDQQKIKSKKSNKFDTQNNIEVLTVHETEFTGYAENKNSAKILEIFIGNDTSEIISKDQEGFLVIDKCPFYAESGGQIGDSGKIISSSAEFIVRDTQKRGKAYLLIGKQIKGSFDVGEIISAEIDIMCRTNIKSNHSATHLLHSALINNLGNNVQQKGSLVSDSKLRFDFSYDKALNKAMLAIIENEVNEYIDEDIPAKISVMNKDKAIGLGAIALFGEKYDDNVRVMRFGEVSTELCGGTHVNSTGEIEVFKILSESSVASGIRRIEAITGMSAKDYLTKRDNVITDICQTLNVHDDDLKNKINNILEDNKKLKKQNDLLLKEITNFKILKIINNNKIKFGININVIYQEYVENKVLKKIIEDIKSSNKNLVLTVIQKNKSKIEIYVLVTKDCFKITTAKEIINMINDDIGATGGGREDFAQAGLEFDGNVNEFVRNIETKIVQLISKSIGK